MKSKTIVVAFVLLIKMSMIQAQQANVVSASLNPENVSGILVSNVVLNNPVPEFSAQLKVTIYSSDHAKLVEVISDKFLLKAGVMNLNNTSVKVNTIEYSNRPQATYVKSFHKLTSGSYSFCVNIIGNSSSELLEEFCDEVEVVNDFDLALVSPFDEEVIDNPHPILIWTHTDPFTVVEPNVYYLLRLVEKRKDQTSESAIVSNPVLFSENNLLTHTVNYPLNAPPLMPGKFYSWQVQKISFGKIINQSESWQFSLAEKEDQHDVKYAVMSSKPSSTYSVKNGKFYFKYDEEYDSDGKLKIKLTGPDGKELPVTVTTDDKEKRENYKRRGYNAYLLDADKLKLKSGTYLLETFNEKNERYKLSFKIE